MASQKAIANEIGRAVQVAARNGKGWYNPHMAAAAHAVVERIPMVDLILDVRDARIPFSSENHQLRNYHHRARRIVVMNKMDLASRTHSQGWARYFEQQNCFSYGVNSHNKESVKGLLNFLQAQIRDLKRSGHSSYTTTVMLAGVPNVGKSALANSLHQIGRISAAGRLKHATVSPQPGETKNISSLKIASHPNIYVLDTPGILPPEIHDVEVCSKLTLTGAIKDCLVGERVLACYFLSILGSGDEYKKWARFSTYEDERSLEDQKAEFTSASDSDVKRKRQYRTDHTQDFIVQEVRRTLFETISTYNGNPENELDLKELIKIQFTSLREAFQVPAELGDDDAHGKVAAKLLNLYRTGRLGHYTLDPLPMSSL
ncbi:DAR GTPase 2, mitochondrial isoform X2 [Tripterygium wilfordii]|uniref:DAR GTPase 2, mitochondrial isoform X2 n=1 Tax=Tripterygium wilfordii TaxID=458696 RepID=UPI0018F81B61|nr:DAR GTPase 2, mitochondrial isoform X2 [Tripterygium wilfordii]